MEDRIVQFVRALRGKGVRVSLAETTDSFYAIELLGIQDREQFRLSLRTTLIKNAADQPVFDELFPLFFGQDLAPQMTRLSEDLTDEEADALAEAMRSFNHRVREMLEKLIAGEPLTKEELDRLGKIAGLEYADDTRYQKWMQQRMEQALKFPQIREAMQELMAIMQEMGMTGERLQQMREVLQENLSAMQDQLAQFTRQRMAENMSDNADDDDGDSLMDRPFSSLTDADMDKLRREVGRLAAILRTRVALRQKRASTGQLDAKATLRANLKHDGVPFDVRYRNRKRKPKLVVICDISTSMRHMSEMMLSLLYSMQDQISRTHAFAFIDHLEYISPDFSRSGSKEAVQQVLIRMPPGYYSTDLGSSLQNFVDDFYDTVDHRTTLIMVGDGRNNYNNPRLDLFTQIARRANRTIWLIPEPSVQWGTGDSDMLEYYPHCDDVLQINTLSDLSAAIDGLLSH